MSRLSRRTFLAGTAASFAAGPALAQRGRTPPAPETDCIVVGAGAAGIAAARRLREAGRSFVLIEASNRIGGRCVTDTQSFGVPFDRGAHLIYNPASNPLTRLARPTGLDVYPSPSAQRIRIGRRNARESELEDYLTASVRANRAMADATRGRGDVSAGSAVPRDLGEWQSTVEFALGPYVTGKDIGEISANDLIRADGREAAAICRQGCGALLAKLGEGLPVQFDTALRLVDILNRGTKVELQTSKGSISAKYCIITASTNVVLDRIKFDGGLGKRHQDAFERLKLGSFDHIALELNGNPLGLPADDLVFEKASGPRTAALLANIGNTPLSVVEVGGKFGRDLAARGEKAMVEFAVEWLSGMFGPNVRRAVGRTKATQWNNDQWTQGAIASASPGGQAARRILMEPVRNRIFFAGEAVHETAWGTVGGAWESGTRAADTVVRRVLGQPDPAPPKAEIEVPEKPVATGRQIIREDSPGAPGSSQSWCFTNPNSQYCKPRRAR
jgi:monoamine oxidase